jgi:hypothetical protein
MPRRSSASLAVIAPAKNRLRLAPSPDAPEDVKAVFREILQSSPADHFTISDAPLIQAYAEAISLSRQAAVALDRDGVIVGGRPSPWVHVQEKAVRALAALSARLRLSPQHRMESKVAGRKAGALPPSIYEIDDDE